MMVLGNTSVFAFQFANFLVYETFDDFQCALTQQRHMSPL